MKGYRNMRELTLRPIRRQCFVPGCRNIHCYVVTRSREMPVGLILCADCAKDLYRVMFPEEAEAAAPAKETPHTVEIVEKKTATRKKKTDDGDDA